MDEVALQAMRQQHPSRAAGKAQAVAARTGEWSTGSSTSSGEGDKKFKSQDAEITELRAQVERLRRQGREAGQDGSPSQKGKWY